MTASQGQPGEPESVGPGRWPVLAARNARLLLATRLTGQAADGLLQAALGSFVLFTPERQTSAAQVATTFAVLLLPYSLVGPFAGILLDRWSRARVLVAANLARAAVILAVVPIVAAGHDGLDLGVVVLLALGLSRLVLAGLSAGLPHTVAVEHLVTANALFPTAGTITSGAATVVGLLLMPALGPAAPQHLIVGVAATLVLAALIALQIPRGDLGPGPRDFRERGTVAQDAAAVVQGLVRGIAHLRTRRRARRAFTLVAAMRLIFGLALVDTLLIVRQSLNTPDQAASALSDFALTAAAASIGSLLAAVATPRASRRLAATAWAGWTTLVAAAITPLGLSAVNLAGLALGSLAMGFAGQSMKIAGDTMIQLDVTDEFRGRIFSLYDVALNVALVTGMTLVALTAPASGVYPPLWLGISALLLATGIVSLRAPGPA